MKLKVTLQSPGGADTDLVATVDSTTTVGQLAEYLVRADPERQRSGTATPNADLDDAFTLALVDQDYRALDPRATIAEGGLRSGTHVAVTRRSEGYADRGKATAKAVVVAGPATGQEFDLSPGTAYVGRGRGCEVQVEDPSVSRRHAKLLVSDVVEVLDLGSSNGVLLGSDQVDRVVLKPGDVFTIGETSIEVRLAKGSESISATGSAALDFSRSPRIAPVYQGQKFEVPELPERKKPQRMPFIALLVPVFLGLVLFAVTGRAITLLFLLMMPLMLVGNTIESRRSAKAEYAEDMADFREDLSFLVEDIKHAHETEAVVRRGEHPAVGEAIAATNAASPLLWTRRPGEPGFLEFRLGLGTLPSRSHIEMPSLGRSKAEAWLEVSQQMAGLDGVDDVPVVAFPLRKGAIGVSGPRALALPLARSIMVQAVALHSPAEVVVAAFASQGSAEDWDWLKWVPHTASAHSPISTKHTASTGPAAAGLLNELEDLLASGGHEKRDQPLPVRVVVLVENDAPIDRSRLVQLAEKGWKRGVVVVWVAPTTAMLPAACRTFVEADANSEAARVGFVEEAVVVVPIRPDRVDVHVTLQTAKRLSPLVDSGAPIDDDSDLPRAVSFVTLAGRELAGSDAAIIEKWTENRSILTGPFAPHVLPRKPGNLRAVIGQGATGPYSVDLRTDGPHALVGGTTGAGKSELLQAWLLGMATANSPQRVTFLLVDYKGGSAFRDIVHLPHTVGLVTDLSQHLVRRALESLAAELHYREHLLARHKAKDLVELERRGEVDAPPSLIIVVDEFAALVQEVPDFVDGVVNVAQRGRSLGLHLILATQRPAGVIRDNLRANTNLRMALRMADENDSTDVLGTPAAAFFDPALPGRALAKSGPGRLVPFQTGYAGGWTSDTPPPPDLKVGTLGFGAARMWELPVAPEEQGDKDDLGPTDIQRVVAQITAAAKTAELPAPRKPWLPELATVYDLAKLPSLRRDDEIVFGVADAPEEQAQPTMSFRPDKEGNLAVFGSSGSGKSTFLRSIAFAAGFTVRGGPCHVYGLDFGNRGLSMLEDLPHVGTIVGGQDHERLTRLFGMLRETIDERAVRYSRVSAATITDYRRISASWDEPRIFVLVDGLTAFRQAYETGPRHRWVDMFQGLLADGRPVGVHFILSVDARNGLPGSLGSSVQSRVVLRMATVDDYGFLGVPMDVLSMASPPGRALVGDREVQCAVLGGTSDVTVQAKAAAGFAEAVRKSGQAPAAEIRSLVEQVDMSTLPDRVGDLPVIGIGSTTLGPTGFDPRGTFVVVGPSGSGRTTTLATMGAALRRWNAQDCLVLLTPRKSSDLLELPIWTHRASTPDAIVELAGTLRTEIAEGTAPAHVSLVIERVDDLAGIPTEQPIADLVKVLVDNDHFVVAEGETTWFSSNFGLPGALKTSRSGMSLQPDGIESQSIFKNSFPAYNRAEMPEGRGFLVQRGRNELLQVALPR